MLTCAHLFRDGDGQTRIWFPNGNRLSADLAGIDQEHDLATLTINVESDKRAVELATSSPQPGEVVFGCGYGLTGSFRCQAGTVVGFGYSHHGTAPSRTVPSNALPSGTASSETLMFTGGARQGDSGGGVFNGAGRLVAVVWGTDESRTMATTTCHVRQFLKSLALRTQGRRKRPLSKQGLSPPPAPASPSPAIVSPATPPQRPTPKPEATTNKLFGLADRLDSLRQRVEASEQTNLAASKQSAKHLDGIVGTLSMIKQRLDGGQRLALGAAAATAVSPTKWLLPVVCGALGISTPPTAVIVALKLFRWWAHRRLRKRRTSAAARRGLRRRRHDPATEEQPSEHAVPPPSKDMQRRQLNDNYAEQLNSLMEYSGGRNAAQDATLGREYDRELRQAATRSGNPEVVQFADKLLQRVTARFRRIHADNPVPAEPSA